MPHDLRPADAGWTYVGFAEHRMRAGATIEHVADGLERAVVVLEGAATINAGGQRFGSLGSRDSVFDGPPAPVVLVSPDADVEIVAEQPCTIIIADAPDAPDADYRDTRLIAAESIHVETRSVGNTERRIHHLLPPDAEAGRLILFEVYTPGGNWSSYPPHKHDTEDPPREAYLEELYYYRFARPEGWAFARVYTADGTLDESFSPHDGDIMLVPRGYHPVGQPAGYDGYYLNVMAGHHRAWHFTLDPDHAWLMDWETTATR
jgi:5-deoxy-glucuronate isomerase